MAWWHECHLREFSKTLWDISTFFFLWLCVPLLALGSLYCLTTRRGPVSVSFGKVPNCVLAQIRQLQPWERPDDTQHKPDLTAVVLCSFEVVEISSPALENHQPVPQPIRLWCTWWTLSGKRKRQTDSYCTSNEEPDDEIGQFQNYLILFLLWGECSGRNRQTGKEEEERGGGC